jgi:hypothetical protein
MRLSYTLSLLALAAAAAAGAQQPRRITFNDAISIALEQNLAVQAQRHQVAVDVRRAYLDAQYAEQQLAAASVQLSAAQKAVDATQIR